jgi:hypothetical protein
MAKGPIDVMPDLEAPPNLVREGPSHRRARRSDRAFAEDPSVHFLVDPPKTRTQFKSWFALAFFAGLLLALAIIAITT